MHGNPQARGLFVRGHARPRPKRRGGILGRGISQLPGSEWLAAPPQEPIRSRPIWPRLNRAAIDRTRAWTWRSCDDKSGSLAESSHQ